MNGGLRPAVQYTIGFAVLVVGAGVWWAVSGPPAAEPVELLPVRPEGLEPAEEPVVGSLTPEQRETLLDDLQDFEEDRLGPREATERRRLREQILEARTQPQTP